MKITTIQQKCIRYTRRKGIYIFDKKLLLLPYNDHNHWSLFVVMNCGLVIQGDEKKDHESYMYEIPCILHLDSCNMHNTAEFADKTRTWFNYEYHAHENDLKQAVNPVEDPFNSNSIPHYRLRGE
jgi:hypothetical protein